MERDTTQGTQDTKPIVSHDELAIILGASRFDPAHINPDFLRYNGIVDANWQVDPPVIIESGFSLVEYNNGLSLTATNDHLRVSQTVQTEGIGETLVPDVVNRYLPMAPWPVEYQHIYTDLIGVIPVAGNGFNPQFSPLEDLSQRVRFSDLTPIMQVRAEYRFPDKSITIYASEVRNESEITSLRFSAHIHRGIASDISPAERDEFIKSTLEKWHDDTRDFDELARQFYSSYTQKKED